jgi:hypothetical protein
MLFPHSTIYLRNERGIDSKKHGENSNRLMPKSPILSNSSKNNQCGEAFCEFTHIQFY